MYDTDFNSKRFFILLTAVCVVFFIVIIKAFDYLPDSSQTPTVALNGNSEFNTPAQGGEAVSEEETETAEDERNEKDKLEVELKNTDAAPEIEELESISSSEVSETSEKTTEQSQVKDEVSETFARAQSYKDGKNYPKALEEYSKISSLTQDAKVVAKSYEEIATIYAISKRYGSALSFAQKGYNLSPSTSREMLLARLYYKTGELDKATQRVNNVLRRDFSADNQ